MSMPISIDKLEKDCDSGDYVEIKYTMKPLKYSLSVSGLNTLLERLEERQTKISEITIIGVKVWKFPF